jgi:hypothetical protein
MKFGDIVINEWAGNKNLNKTLMFVKKNRKRIKCLSLGGDIVEFYNDKNLKLTVSAQLDLKNWTLLSNKVLNTVDQ